MKKLFTLKKIFLLIVIVFALFIVGCDKLSEDEVKILEVKDALVVPTETTTDIELITSYEVDGVIASITWSSSNTNVISNDGKVYQGDEDVIVDLEVTITINNTSQSFKFFSVKVLAKEVTYTINYDLDGGTCEGLVYEFVEDSEVILPTPTKEGFAFLGWYQGDVKVTNIENKNYVLVAKWQAKELTIISDTEELFVDYEAELSIDGYNMLDFNITASNPDLVVIDPEGYVSARKIGTVVITCTLKSDPTVTGSITLQIKPKSPMLSLSTNYIIVNNIFEINDPTYDDFSIFNIEYDSEMIEYNNGFKALKAGKTKIKFAFKEFPDVYDEIEFTIFEVEPELSISSEQFVVGSTTRIDIANYDEEDLKIEALEVEKVAINGRLITALETGEVTIKVSLKIDPTIFSTLDLVITPKLPGLKISSENILVGGKTRLIIDNLSELEYTNLDDFKVEILLSSLFITIDDNWFIEGKSLGTAEIKVTAKNNDEISSTIKVNVVETSDQRDANDEIAAGPLVLTLDNFDGYIHAGDMDYIKIDGAKDLTKYKWVSSDNEVLNVYEDGRIICIAEGSAYVIAYNLDNKEVTGRLYIKVYGTPNVNYVDRLIKMAESQLGYVEGPDNDTKYGDWYGIPNGAWCAMFVSWCAYQVGISTDVIVKYASCSAGRKWFEDNNRFGYKEDYTPKAGDIIFFLSDGASHTGIVINCDGNKVYTIEGNTANMCAKRSYDLNWHTITGYGIPNYPAFDGEVSGGDIGGSTDGGDSSTT